MQVLIQRAPGAHPVLLGGAVECGVGELDAQRDVVDRHAEQVLEEHDTGLAPGDLGEVAGSALDEIVDEPVCLGADLGPQRLHPARREVGVEDFAEFLLSRRVEGDHQITGELLSSSGVGLLEKCSQSCRIWTHSA